MATTPVSISNLAGAYVASSDIIASLTENSKLALRCNQFYDDSVDFVLRAHPWRFASARITLADEGSPPTHYAYRYAYPSGCACVRRVIPVIDGGAAVKYEVFGGIPDEHGAINTRSIVTDQEAAELEYTARVTNTAVFSADFANAVALQLAIRICLPLTGDLKLLASLQQQYTSALLIAQTNGERENYSKQDHTPDWIAARN